MLQLFQQTRYVRAAIQNQLQLALGDYHGLDRQFGERQRILLKPNFVVPANDASNTHPAVYMAIAQWLRTRYPNCHIGIGESPAFGSCQGGLQAHGVLDECRDLGIEVVEFRRAITYPGIASQRGYRQLTVAAELADWDAVINVPKIKTHQQFGFTAATKNLYGCVTGPRKFIRHNLCGNDPLRFAQMIHANARKVGCVLHIGDGIEAMHVDGPRGGKPYPLGQLIIAADPLLHDWLVCRLIGLDPHTTPLFEALDKSERDALREQFERLQYDQPPLPEARGFIHALPSDISFAPGAVVRSGWRRLRHRLAQQKAA